MIDRLDNFTEATVAIIPARGGSTRIKSKNLKKVGNDSLILNSLKTCKESGIFDEIILSTDSQEIANESKKLPTIIHERSECNSTSISSTESVVFEIFKDFPMLFEKQVLIYLIQCTSPFLHVYDLRKSFELIKKGSFEHNCLISGYFFNKFIWEKKQKMKGWTPINYNPDERPRSQDKDPLFIENGSFYVFGSSNFRTTNCRIHGSVGIFEMEENRSIDIDTNKDLDYAKFICDYVKR
tara:strand:+ start:5179 stop:5895 length:717 start_codon:yes stop_codon:yes gene_type:complete